MYEAGLSHLIKLRTLIGDKKETKVESSAKKMIKDITNVKPKKT